MQLYAIELRTERWQEALTWYREALGLRVAVRIPEDQYALLIADGGRLALMGRQHCGPNQRVSLAFEVDDLEVAAERLLRQHTKFDRVDNAEGLEFLCTTDPDGNPINLFRWPARAKRES